MRRVFQRSSEFVAGACCAAALILLTLGGAGLLSAQVFLGPKRDFLALATAPSGQRDVSIDMTTSPPRFELGRSVINGLRMSGGPTGVTPVITAAVTGADAGAGLTINPGTSGTVSIGGNHTSGIAFFPAVNSCRAADADNLIPLRVAANDWALARTATGAETIEISCDLNLQMTRTTSSKGMRLDDISIAYEIVGSPSSTAAALTSQNLPTLRRTRYANATANSIDASGLTLSGTLATATQTTPYLTGLTISGTSFQTTTNVNLNLDWAPVLQNLSQYRLYGISVTYTHALY